MKETPAASGQEGKVPFKHWAIREANAILEQHPDGSFRMRSAHAPGPRPRSIAHLFVEVARAHPDRPLLLQRTPGQGPWRSISYGEVLRAAEGIAQQLRDHDVESDRSVLVLSGNSIEHALVTFGCYLAGVPVAPISPAFSLVSSDHSRLKHCVRLTRPAVVFAQSGTEFAAAIATLRELDPRLLFVTADGSGAECTALGVLTGTRSQLSLEDRLSAIGPDTVAKYLFTSGSTGMPKAVPQRHGMMTAVIAAFEGLRLPDPEVDNGEAARTLEWMPWSHLAAGNANFNNAIAVGGTIYLDDGKPAPGLFDITIRNLREVQPVEFASAPVAYGMLAEAMERDPELRKAFFKNMRYMAYGGATLSNDLFDRLQALAITETGRRVPFTTLYGSTETQGITMTHWATERVGLIGLPLPGLELKLVPNGAKLEVRVKGDTVMNGYVDDPAKTAAAFDEEGFYKLGDAVRFVDPTDPSQGLVFDGRVAEDFKLNSGTWVSVGILRPELVAACSPYVRDAVITGQDQAFVGALIWPSASASEAFKTEDGSLDVTALAATLKRLLSAHNAGAGGSSKRIERFIVLSTPPSIDAGELTDKGYINQRAAQDYRSAEIARLFSSPAPTDVMVVGRQG